MHVIVQLIRAIMFFFLTLNVACEASRVKNFFDEHYNNTKQRKDKISYPNRRRTQLYSRNSGKHVQILPNRGKVVARGESGDRYAGLIILTVSFGKVQIKGVVTDRYICFDKRGHLISKRRPTSKCIFRETYGKDAFTQYESPKMKGRFLAFSKNGNPRHRVIIRNARNKGAGKGGTKVSKAVQFVERPKPRKIKNRYYRGKGKRISEETINLHKKLARQQAKNSGTKLRSRNYYWTPPLREFGNKKRRGKNNKKDTERNAMKKGNRQFKTTGNRSRNSKSERKRNGWKYLTSSKQTFRKSNRG